MTQTIIFVSDLHCNSTVAICPPEVNLDNGDIHVASNAQMWLWDKWQNLVERVGNIENDKILIVNGDPVEGDTKRRSFQLISQNPTDMIEIAKETLNPLVDECDSVYFTRGTPAHGGNSGFLEEMLAAFFTDKIVREPDTRKLSHWKIKLVMDEVRFDIAHHGRMGQLPWTQHGYTLRLAAQLMYTYQKEREPLPHIAVRSHQHRWSDSFDNEPVRVIYTPAWQLATEFILRISESSIAAIGALLVHVDGDKYEIEKIKYKPESRQWIIHNNNMNTETPQLQKEKSSESLKKDSLISKIFQKAR